MSEVTTGQVKELLLHKIRYTRENLQAYLDDPDRLFNPTSEEFSNPLTSKEAVELLLQNKYTRQEAREIVKNWRKFAKNVFGWKNNQSIAYYVKAGFRVREPSMYPGSDIGLFKGDLLTKESLVFWIPRILPNSCGMSVTEQRAMLLEIQEEYNLPEHHLDFFGSISLLSALILPHYRRTNEQVPLAEDGQWNFVRTDTCRITDSSRLYFHFPDIFRLDPNYWFSGDKGYPEVGCFPLGVELFD
ncbi:MAG: hypothetical protein U9P90_02620 [Patescibacteria group bacterium]|nr:hypothetical protein [Patescibacteria group bacterium]